MQSFDCLVKWVRLAPAVDHSPDLNRPCLRAWTQLTYFLSFSTISVFSLPFVMSRMFYLAQCPKRQRGLWTLFRIWTVTSDAICSWMSHLLNGVTRRTRWFGRRMDHSILFAVFELKIFHFFPLRNRGLLGWLLSCGDQVWRFCEKSGSTSRQAATVMLFLHRGLVNHALCLPVFYTFYAFRNYLHQIWLLFHLGMWYICGVWARENVPKLHRRAKSPLTLYTLPARNTTETTQFHLVFSTSFVRQK